MKYEFGPRLVWAEVPPDALLSIRPNRKVDVGDHFLLVSEDGPGWAALTKAQLPLLEQIDRQSIAQLATPLRAPVFKKTIEQLYSAGLISIGGHTGLFGEREGNESGEATLRPKGAPPLIRLSPHPPFPSTLLLKLTGACNWACTYCYDYEQNRFRESIDLKAIVKTIDGMLAKHREINIIFHGGEPLLRFRELKRIVSHATTRGEASHTRVRFSIQTNGALLTEEIIDFLNRHSFGIGMSIDGPPAVNDLVRVDLQGRGTTRVIVDLFKRFPDFMTRRVGFITTVTSLNVHRLREVAEFLRALGVRSWKTAIFDLEGRGKEHPELLPAVAPYQSFLEWSLGQCAGGSWRDFKFKTILELLDTVLSSVRNNLCLKFPCGAGREFLVASADGQAMACDATYDRSFALGPLGEGIESAQRSEAAHKLYEREQWLLTEAECARCPWLHYCAGTCMAKALLQHGTVKAVDEFECAVRKHLFPVLFRELVNPDSGLQTYYYDCQSPGRSAAS
jgi:uncharacterized protein